VITSVQGYEKIIEPQPGKQLEFCSSRADIVIYGGAAYGGKTVGLLIEASRNIADTRYTGVIFRRKYNEIVSGGGLWDTSTNFYPHIGGFGVRGKTEWAFRSGARIKFNHINQEANVYDHQGAAYVFIGFDELTHFSKFQFFYLLTRNRPPAGCFLRPYVRATTNPDADSWVADFIKWWIDEETGYPIPERAGVLRFFTVFENDVVWVDETWRGPNGEKPKSVTFIPSSIDDNPLGNVADPNYRANLLSQDRVTRERLLKGNWHITFSGGMLDPRWFEVVEDYPRGMRLVRYWDFAATEVTEAKKNDPDWTAGALCGIHDGILYIIDVEAFRETPGAGEKIIKETARQDGHDAEQWWEEEKGSSGKWSSEYLKKVFEGLETHPDPVSGSKIERARPWAAWAEFGKVKIVRGDWNRRFLARAGTFPNGKRDEIDAVSGAFKALVSPKKVFQRYVPNDAGHFRTFGKSLEDFQKVSAENVEVYVSLWADAAGGVYGGCFVWAKQSKRLRLYNEIFMPMPTSLELFNEISEKLVVGFEPKNNWVGLTKIVGNDAFFNINSENTAKEMKRFGLRVRPNNTYDENAAILKINSMFAQKQIVIHTDCMETDVQWRGWLYELGRPTQGFPLARALCLIVSELRSSGKLRADPPMAPYSTRKQNIRNRLRQSSGRENPSRVIRDEDKMHEYLTA
jgi:predicted phage terminase large subunit-like protein